MGAIGFWGGVIEEGIAVGWLSVGRMILFFYDVFVILDVSSEIASFYNMLLRPFVAGARQPKYWMSTYYRCRNCTVFCVSILYFVQLFSLFPSKIIVQYMSYSLC